MSKSSNMYILLKILTSYDDENDFNPSTSEIKMIGVRVLDDSMVILKDKIIHKDTERDTIESFINSLEKMKPPFDIITFNGGKFDIPIILLRALKYDISCRWLSNMHNINYYSDNSNHVDLCHTLAFKGRYLSMIQLAKLIDFNEFDENSLTELDFNNISDETAEQYIKTYLNAMNLLLIKYKILRGV